MKRLMDRSPRMFLLAMMLCAFAMVGFVASSAWAETVPADGGTTDQAVSDTATSPDTGSTPEAAAEKAQEKMGCSAMEGQPAGTFMLMLVLVALGVAGMRRIVVDPLDAEKRK